MMKCDADVFCLRLFLSWRDPSQGLKLKLWKCHSGRWVFLNNIIFRFHINYCKLWEAMFFIIIGYWIYIAVLVLVLIFWNVVLLCYAFIFHASKTSHAPFPRQEVVTTSPSFFSFHTLNGGGTNPSLEMMVNGEQDLHARSHYGVGDWSFDALLLASQHQSVLKLVWLLRAMRRWENRLEEVDFFLFSQTYLRLVGDLKKHQKPLKNCSYWDVMGISLDMK